MAAELHWRDRHFVIEYSGIVVPEESTRVHGELVGDERCDGVLFGMVDCRDVERFTHTPRDFEVLGAYVKAFYKISKLDSIRVAVVAGCPESAKAAQVVIDNSRRRGSTWESRVFLDYDEAMDWARP